MKQEVMLALVMAALVLAVAVFLADRRRKRIALGVYRERPLMTGNELEFFGRLVAALPQHYVFPQVAMSALIEAASTSEKRRYIDRLRVAQQRVDYVICDRRCEVVAVVELDDRTHQRARDEIRDERLAQGGIRTVRFESRAKPSVGTIRSIILD
ncbi:DUF2726 domain-containing protein [Pseudoduganella lutea]|uniref:DUF2726 domain-containing protein n=1 Tax=Pseudoduganella lutea TaxID=321985 RepID=A0A4P6L539_9BURK|nr:DUF2726 domain-containing protein [Pseudoduganella lutea]QBE66720.1 DUF2726 domain-containing protein [Pseudoduganella lutea]